MEYSTLSQAASVPLVIEVVSSNWRDDYYLKSKLAEAQRRREDLAKTNAALTLVYQFANL